MQARLNWSPYPFLFSSPLSRSGLTKQYDSKRIKALSDRLLHGLLALEHTTQNGDPDHF